jgi:hypothetical protein
MQCCTSCQPCNSGHIPNSLQPGVTLDSEPYTPPQTADLVREERFRNMESLDSLLALSRPEDDEDAVAAAGNGTRRPSGRSQA